MQRKSWLIPLLVYTFIGLLSLFPLFVTLTASMIANAAGCVLNEGDIHPCLIRGHDWGERLYTMGMFAWLCIFTLPIGFWSGVGYTLYLLVRKKKEVPKP